MLYEVITELACFDIRPLPAVSLPESLLYEVFANLIVNSIRYGKAEDETIDRITSYNVCYSKLLRGVIGIVRCLGGQVLHSTHDIHHGLQGAIGGGQHGGGVFHVALGYGDTVALSLHTGRITSYNVCYTKLLRDFIFRPRGSLFGNAKAADAAATT